MIEGRDHTAGSSFVMTGPPNARGAVGITACDMASGGLCAFSAHGMCFGDAGGAAFMDVGGNEALVGVMSYGDSACDTFTVVDRLDIEASWIATWTAAHVTNCPPGAGGCPCAADGQCNRACKDPASDPDCPVGCGADGTCVAAGCGAPDPDCPPPTDTGQRCKNPNDCSSGLCLVASDEPSIRYCSAECGSCPDSMTCENSVCVYVPPTPGAHGGVCATSADCAQSCECTGGVCCGGSGGGCAIGPSRGSCAAHVFLVFAALGVAMTRRRHV